MKKNSFYSSNASIGFSFPENYGSQSHTVGLNLFGVGGGTWWNFTATVTHTFGEQK